MQTLPRTVRGRGRDCVKMDDVDRRNERERLYRLICEADLKEAAELMRDIFPSMRTYEMERSIIEAYKARPA
jgi:hypothetical protein